MSMASPFSVDEVIWQIYPNDAEYFRKSLRQILKIKLLKKPFDKLIHKEKVKDVEDLKSIITAKFILLLFCEN